MIDVKIIEDIENQLFENQLRKYINQGWKIKSINTAITSTNTSGVLSIGSVNFKSTHINKLIAVLIKEDI